jgi:hypothetical protein
MMLLRHKGNWMARPSSLSVSAEDRLSLMGTMWLSEAQRFFVYRCYSSVVMFLQRLLYEMVVIMVLGIVVVFHRQHQD